MLKTKSIKARTYFVLFCAYYVFATYLIPSSGIVEKYSMQYFAIIVPSWIFIIINFKRLFREGGFLVNLWWLFVISMLIVAVLQPSLSVAYNGLYFGLLAIAIISTRGFLKTSEINILFLLLLIGSIVSYVLGVTDYGFLPGQADATGCHKSLSYRVSLFRVPSESAAFSLFVLVWNVFHPLERPSWSRWIFILLSIYFVLFSGIRTAYISLLVISPILIYNLLPRWSFVKRIATMLSGSLIAVCIVFLISDGFASSTMRDFILKYFIRADTCAAIQDKSANVVAQERFGKYMPNSPFEYVSTQWLEKTINRHCAIGYQLKLFFTNPIVGNHYVRPQTVEQIAMADCAPDLIDRFCESCVLSTYWLSRTGLAGFVLITIYFVGLVLSILCGSGLVFCCFLAFGIFLQGWGVMFTPYNFVFYILISLVSMGKLNKYSRNRMVA